MGVLISEVDAKQFQTFRQVALKNGVSLEVKGREDNVIFADLTGDPEKTIRTCLRGGGRYIEWMEYEPDSAFEPDDIAYIQSQPPVRWKKR